MRASDADRERTVGTLRDHYSTGHITGDELSERTELAYGAQTHAELERVTGDLPGEEIVPERPKPARALRMSLRIHAGVFVVVNVLLIAIWAVAGGGYFWPVWPLLGWGIGLGAHAVVTRAVLTHLTESRSSADAIAEEVRRAPPDLRAATAPDGTVTILFSDIASSTDLNAQLGDHAWLDVLRRHHAVIRQQIERNAGFEVKVQGDGFMVAFADAARAVSCALDAQDAIASTFGDGASVTLRIRIGMHTGEAIREQRDFYGTNVALAARITDAAGSGEVLASAAVRDRVGGDDDPRFGPAREIELKGLGAHRVHAVTRAPNA